MTQERYIKVNNIEYLVVISDEKMTLLAAKQAGRVIVGYLHPEGDQDLSPAEYLVEHPDAADDIYLERVVRRRYGLPWQITETERLQIREFGIEDLPKILPEYTDSEADRIFTNAETLDAYIHSQYRFFEYGIWALIRKEDNILIGKAGITDGESGLELGYHIFSPYRGCGYATEACRSILSYVKTELAAPVNAKTETGNQASVRVLKKLGFVLMEGKYNPPEPGWYQYVWNC